MSINTMGTAQLRAELLEAYKRESELKGKLDKISIITDDIDTNPNALLNAISDIVLSDLCPSCHGKGDICGFKCPDCKPCI